MFTADQLVAHLIGDYILQSDWMANNKTKAWIPTIAHVLTYMLPFLFLTQSVPALAFIVITHAIIDHYRLARYICWVKNFLAPKWIGEPEVMLAVADCSNTKTGGVLRFTSGKFAGKELKIIGTSDMGRVLHLEAPCIRNYPWSECEGTGYYKERPVWMSVWLMIITDNTMHFICNAIALKYLA